jgi:hypothetical protein
MRSLLILIGNYHIMRSWNNPLWRAVAGAWLMWRGYKIYKHPGWGWVIAVKPEERW